MTRLADKRAVVTAGGAGLGRVIAESLAGAGARVHVCDVDADSLAELGSGLSTTVGDVGDPVQIDRVFDEALEILGGLDILVNNAGVAGEVGPIDSLDVDDWARTLAVNLSGAFYCCRRAVPELRAAGGGSIVSIASNAGLHGFPFRAPYCSSKWGLVGLTKALAVELGPDRIRVNAVCPGSVEGPRIDRVIGAEAAARGVTEDEVRASYLAQSSLGELVPPEDVANLVLHLCADEGARMSGQALGIDGHTQSLV